MILTIPSFSYADSSLGPIPISSDATASNIYTNGFKYGYNSSNLDYYVISKEYPVYIFHSGTYHYLASDYSTQCYSVAYNGSYVNTTNLTTYDSTYNLYYMSLGGAPNTYCENYTSLSDGLSAVRGYIDSSNLPSVKYPFTIQNGYLFVYDLGSSGTMYSFDLTSTSEEYSDIGSDPFPDTNQSYWFSDSLPEIDETTIPASGAVTITWQKGSNTNIFGQTQSMVSSISGTSTGRYLYVYNPPVHYKWSGSSNPTASETVNYPMVIDGVSDSDNFYVYDSIARLVDFNQGGTVAGTVTGEPGIGTVSGGSISVTTSDGSIYVQTSGGSTDISGANGGSLAENISGLQQTLDNFVSQFVKLLSAPISHIQQLISSGSNFFEVMTGLFDWLPSEVSGVIVSALVVMVVIGVIKMLL